MKTVRISVVAAAIAVLASAAQASDPFYTSLLTRGISDAQRGEHFKAAKELRIAGFGLVDDARQYLRAQVYLANALERLGQHNQAVAAVEKAVQAERIGGGYASIAIDPETRTAFEALVTKSLRPEQLAMVPAFRVGGKETSPFPPPPGQAGAPVPPPERKEAPAPIRQTAVQPPPSQPPVTQQPAVQQPVVRQKSSPPSVVEKPVTTQAQAQPQVPTQTPVQTQRPAPPPPPVVESPLVAAAKHQPSQSLAASDSGFQIGEAQQLLNEGKILAARQIYLHLAQSEALSRATMLDVAKGLNLTSAWRESSNAYQKVMPFRAGEEMHQFYEAVNRYELGDMSSARDMLTRALPALPVTRETSLYKAKILGMP